MLTSGAAWIGDLLAAVVFILLFMAICAALVVVLTPVMLLVGLWEVGRVIALFARTAWRSWRARRRRQSWRAERVEFLAPVAGTGQLAEEWGVRVEAPTDAEIAEHLIEVAR